MSKIKRLELTNFRNIKHLVLDFKSNPAIIQGDNNLGKSNVLSAVSWFFTDTLLTDKWGTGENDVNSIIPIDQVKGEYVSVKVTFESGIEFTKVYKTVWDLKTGKPKGHNTEGYINSSLSKNMKLWQEELMKEINFVPTLRGFNELRIFTDPLYALQKIEPKELRQLLVALGCEVTNEEVYKALEYKMDLSYVRENESKYRGNFFDMRADVKRMIKADSESMQTYEAQSKLYNDVEEVDESKIVELDNEIKGLQSKYYSIKDDDTSNKLRELNSKIFELESQKRIFYEQEESKNRIALQEVQAQRAKEQEEYDRKREERSNGIMNEQARIYSEMQQTNETVRAYQKSYANITQSLQSSSEAGKRLIEEQRELMMNLEEVKASTYSDMVTCPMCMHQFVLDPVKEAAFQASKEAKITSLNARLEKVKESIEKQKAVFKNLKEQKEATLREVEKLNPKVKELEAAYDAINYRITEIKLQPLPFEWNTDLQAKEQELRNFRADTSKYDNEIQLLQDQVSQLQQNANAAIEQERAEINRQIEELKAERDELNIAKSKYLTKVQVQENYDLAVAKRNDHEAIYNTINDVIHTMIDMCNKKAYEKTGFEFVMLEETLSDTVKEVCYMIVDGVPFANVNTSRKAIIGTLFISKVKDILEGLGTPKNDLPILFDKLESISLKTFEDNKQVFENCQFIGTKVTEGKEIKVC
jgi:chromosome segregation ATPase